MIDGAPIALLADDLTGALDCAVAFARAGTSTYVSTTLRSETPAGIGVLSVNADTRRLKPDIALGVIRDSVDAIKRSSATLRYVKIDSTLRGHPGLEIAASASANGSWVVLVAPAFPAAGRVVRDGNLLVHGVPLADTEVGNDPLSPVGTSSVHNILDDFKTYPIHDLPLESVRSDGLVDRLYSMANSERGQVMLIACDAETDSDLDLLVAAGLEIDANGPRGGLVRAEYGTNVLLAGSAGLAFALARALHPHPVEQEPATVTSARPPLLIVTASQRSLADRQIRALVSDGMVELHTVEFNLDRASGSVSTTRFDPSPVASSISANRSVALRAIVSEDLSALSATAVRTIADEVTRQLGQIVADLTSQHAIGGLVLIGGDTATAVLSATEASGIYLTAEPLAGVPVGTISGGGLDGVTIATKAGAFGDDQTLVQLLEYLTPPGPEMARNGKHT